MERTPNKSQHFKSTLEKKFLPPILPGFELATFRSRVRHSYQQAIPACNGTDTTTFCVLLRGFTGLELTGLSVDMAKSRAYLDSRVPLLEPGVRAYARTCITAVVKLIPCSPIFASPFTNSPPPPSPLFVVLLSLTSHSNFILLGSCQA